MRIANVARGDGGFAHNRHRFVVTGDEDIDCGVGERRRRFAALLQAPEGQPEEPRIDVTVRFGNDQTQSDGPGCPVDGGGVAPAQVEETKEQICRNQNAQQPQTQFCAQVGIGGQHCLHKATHHPLRRMRPRT